MTKSAQTEEEFLEAVFTTEFDDSLLDQKAKLKTSYQLAATAKDLADFQDDKTRFLSRNSVSRIKHKALLKLSAQQTMLDLDELGVKAHESRYVPSKPKERKKTEGDVLLDAINATVLHTNYGGFARPDLHVVMWP